MICSAKSIMARSSWTTISSCPPTRILIISQGGAYVHNLIAGGLNVIPFDGRMTPLHKAHSTELAGLHDNPCGDSVTTTTSFCQRGDVSPYDKATLPV